MKPRLCRGCGLPLIPHRGEGPKRFSTRYFCDLACLRKHPQNSKLTPEQVLEIRARIKGGERNMDLAEEFGVARSTVSQVRNRKMWRHV